MTVFDRVKELSVKQGISIQEIASRAGLGINSIYAWKKKDPSFSRVEKVANVLGVSTDYLLGHNEKHGQQKTADLADDETIFTYEGKKIPPEDLEYMKRILRGGKP